MRLLDITVKTIYYENIRQQSVNFKNEKLKSVFLEFAKEISLKIKSP